MTQVQTTESPVHDRIRKLLALADSARNSSEAEASSAAEKVQELLQAHNLTLAQVEASGGSGDGGGRGVIVSDRRALYLWQRRLMESLADNNFCLHRVTEVDALDGRRQRSSRRHQLVGRKMNVDVTLDMYDYLSVAVRRAAADAGYDHATRERDHHRFLDGAVERLRERLAERRREKEAESRLREEQARAASGANGTHRELVLSDVYGSEADQNNDALNGFPVGTTATRKREQAEKTARREAEYARLVAEGTEDTEAWYLAHGYGAESAKTYAAEYNRRARRSRRSRGGRGRAQGFTQGQRAHYEKVNSPAYGAGRAAGSSIGLDEQAGAANRRRLGRS